jgi:5-formyltetrahydrofolate cyclo-ligase
MKSKQDHRSEMKAKLSTLDENALTSKSTLLSKNLGRLLSDLGIIQKKLCLGAFAPIAREPLWSLELLEDYQKLTAYPAYGKETGGMTFKMARMSDLTVSKDFGYEILGPTSEALEVAPEVILIPGLVFTEIGERLGRGKGFYDQYLNINRGIKIGICFSLQFVDELPLESHDVRMDYIVTEEKIIKCKSA